MSRLLLAAALLTGCGRYAFEERSSGADAPVADDATDATDAPIGACLVGAVAPDIITVSGQTFRYTSFDNMSAVVGGTMVGVTFATNTQTSPSDNNGNFSFGIATSGGPGDLSMDISRGNYFTTHITNDVLVGEDTTGMRTDPVMHLGDAPTWDMAQMTGIYTSAGGTYNAALGTLNIAIRNCANGPVTGVTVTLMPPAARLFYQSTDGSGNNMTATTSPFTHAIALGVPPGPVTIHATGGGKTFPDRTVTVMAGANNTLTFLHGY